MANTKTYTGGSKSSSPWREIRIVLSETATSTANNNSAISYEVWLDNGNTYFSTIKIGCKVVIDGATILDRAYSSSSQYTCGRNESVKIASGTTTVAHGTDGTKSIASGKISATCSSAGVVATQTVTSNSAWALTAIPRASTIAISTNTTVLGQARTITITRGDSSFTHTLTYSFGSSSGTIATKTTSTSVSWTPAKSLSAQLTNAKSGTGTITCTTYSGNTSVGTSSISFTGTIPVSTVAPNSSTVVMGNALGFTITRASSNLTHTLTYKFGTATGTIGTGLGTSASWTTTKGLAAQVAANNASGSGTVTLTTYNGSATVGTSTASFTLSIPASTFSRTTATVTMGGTQTFNITPAASNITHKLTYAFGSLTNQSIGTGIGTSKTWTVPTSLAAQLSNAKQGTCTVTLTSYNGTAQVGSTSTVTFTAVAPASTMSLSASSVNMGSAVTITITRAATNMTHAITYSFVNASGNVTSTDVTTSASWTPALTLAAQIPSATSGTATLTCTTKIGSATVGTSTKTITLKVPNNSTTQPTISTVTLAPSSTLSSPFNTIFIAGYTKVKATISASGYQSATITAYELTLEGKAKSQSSSPVTSDKVVSASGSVTVTVKVTDSRGFTKTSSQSMTVYEYNEPSVTPKSGATKVVCGRSNSSGTLASNGTYLHIEAGRSIASLNSNNKGSLTYTLYNASNTQIASGTLLSSATGASASTTWTSSTAVVPDITVTYRVALTATDTFGNSSAYNINIPTDSITMDFRAGGKGVGIGMYSQGDNRLDVGWNEWLNADLYVNAIRPLITSTNGGRSKIIPVPIYSFNDLGVSSSATIDVFFEAWLKRVCSDFSTAGVGAIFFGLTTPNSRGIVMCQIYDTSDVTDGLPGHASGMFLPHSNPTGENGGSIYRFGTYTYSFYGMRIYASDTPFYASTATLTYESEYASATKELKVRKYGHVVTINGYVQGMPSQSANTTHNIATLPSGFRPPETIRTVCNVGANAYGANTSAYCAINTSGVLSVYSGVSFTAFYVSASFIFL